MSMRCRWWLAIGLLPAVGLAAYGPEAGGAEILPRRDPAALGVGLDKSLDLKAQLEKTLKAQRPSDFAFIASVVRQIERGKLPRKLVDQTMGYARAKNPKYPFVYFEFALRKQAQKIGVNL